MDTLYAGPSKSTIEENSITDQVGHELADTAAKLSGSFSGIQCWRIPPVTKGKSSRVPWFTRLGQEDCHRIDLSPVSDCCCNLIYCQTALFRIPLNLLFRAIGSVTFFIFTSICRRKSSPSSAAVKNHRQSRNNTVSNSEPMSVSIQLPACINVPASSLPAPHLQMINLPAAPIPTHHQQAVLPSSMITLPSQPMQQSAKQFRNFFPGISSVHLGNASQVIYVPVKLDDSSIVALLDTGSALTIVSDTVARKLNAQLSQSTITKGITANGSIMKLLGQFTPNLTIGQRTMQITCYVASDANCSSPFILGNDVIQQFAQTVSINYHSNTVSFDKIIIPFTNPNHNKTITSPLFQFT
ncbi:hypothetical protein COOONC_19834 [Cooperia oncophora]